MYLKGFQRSKLHSYKFITAAKLIVSSVKDQLGKKTTKKHLLQNAMSNAFDLDGPGSQLSQLLLFY